MLESEVIDEITRKKRTLLCSKLSIAILGFLFSPILASYLYCTNLRRTGQEKKIVSFFVSIVIFNFLALVPFMGFELEWNNLRPLLYINNFLVTLLMIFPFWKNHFGEVKYEEFFPFFRFFLLITLIASLMLFNYLVNNTFSRVNHKPWYIPHFHTFSITVYTIPFIFGKFIYQFLKKLGILILKNGN